MKRLLRTSTLLGTPHPSLSSASINDTGTIMMLAPPQELEHRPAGLTVAQKTFMPLRPPQDGVSIKQEECTSGTAKWNLFPSLGMLLEAEHGR